MNRMEKQIELEKKYKESLISLMAQKPKELSFLVKDEKWQVVGDITLVQEEHENYIRLKTSFSGITKIPIRCLRSITDGFLALLENQE